MTSTKRKMPDFGQINTGKANFDGIYTSPDPREYYRVLYGLDYIIPDLAKGIFGNTIAALEEKLDRPIRVLDVGCSYGNNAALIRFPLDIQRMAQRYGDMQAEGLSTAELIMLDRNYFRSWPRHDIEIIGCDISAPALEYARKVGLIDAAIPGNFELSSIPEEAKELLKGVDLIISTGSIGYVTERTLGKMMEAIGEPAPWVASFVLRMFPYNPIEALLERSGLVTEKLQGVTFVQRRFESEGECQNVLQRLSELGIDPTQKEAEGLYHAEFYLSRPDADVDAFPLDSIATVTSGASRPASTRFRFGADNVIRKSF